MKATHTRLHLARLPRVTIPSIGMSRRRSVHLVAILQARNEAQRLPGFLLNVAPQVDGIVALDDGSSDGTGELLRQDARVQTVLPAPESRSGWDEVGNHRRLVFAALDLGAEWLIALDADERVERDFRARAERVIRRGRPLRIGAFAVHVRELWDSPGQYRVDGLWGRKSVARLFRARADHQFDERLLHAHKAPLQDRGPGGHYPLADLVIYHLKMIAHEDRLARRAYYERADPTARWQPGLGYAYLTDARCLRLRRVPRRRDYRYGALAAAHNA
jgi:glycosyltransferase involved in cell wall biosynthesis